MIDPNRPPPLPASVKGRPVKRVDGSRTFCVTLKDAGKLMGRHEDTIREMVDAGKVDVCRDGTRLYVLIDSLWMTLPEEERRA